LGKGGPCALRDFVAHQDANFVELLPLAVEGQEGADLEVAGGDIDAFGKNECSIAGRCCCEDA
jgi:hypothetical protein